MLKSAKYLFISEEPAQTTITAVTARKNTYVIFDTYVICLLASRTAQSLVKLHIALYEENTNFKNFFFHFRAEHKVM